MHKAFNYCKVEFIFQSGFFRFSILCFFSHPTRATRCQLLNEMWDLAAAILNCTLVAIADENAWKLSILSDAEWKTSSRGKEAEESSGMSEQSSSIWMITGRKFPDHHLSFSLLQCCEYFMMDSEMLNVPARCCSQISFSKLLWVLFLLHAPN